LGDIGIPVEGYHTGTEKYDPEIGVNSLAAFMELGKIKIPYDQHDPRTIELASKLLNEMRAYPEGHTGDSLMALWFAFSQLRDSTAGAYTIGRTLGIDKKPSPIMPEAFKNPDKMKELERQEEINQALEKEAERRIFWGR
jgi:hypothetical protein